MSHFEDLFIDNAHVVQWSGAEDGANGEPLLGARVEVTLLDTAEAEVPGQTWPLTMGYVVGSVSDYRGVMSAAVEVTKGHEYIARVEVYDDGDVLIGSVDERLRATRREA